MVFEQSGRPTPPALPLPEAIPAELRERRLWVGWRFEARDKKWTKTPIDCTNNLARHARANDPATWATLGRALEAAQNSRNCIDGVGVMLGNGLVGIDIDDAYEAQELKPWVAEVVAAMKSYVKK